MGQVRHGSADQHVISGDAPQRVVAIKPVQHIIAAPTTQQFIQRRSGDDIVVPGAVQRRLCHSQTLAFCDSAGPRRRSSSVNVLLINIIGNIKLKSIPSLCIKAFA